MTVFFDSFSERLRALTSSWGEGCVFPVAVSGGGDSMALCLLMLQIVGASRVVGVHFDHALRAESSAEEAWVRQTLEALGVRVLSAHWQGAMEAKELSVAKRGNLMRAARKARYGFFAEVCAENGWEGVLTAHTQDDVAETFLMRAGKGSGLTGLAAMKDVSVVGGVRVVRPLLGVSRVDLREVLRAAHLPWLEDPSNENEVFLRPRLRRLRVDLEAAGVSFRGVADASTALRRAEDALDAVARQVYERHLLTVGHTGEVRLAVDFLQEHDEIALRLLAFAVKDVSGEGLAPRTSKRVALLRALREVSSYGVSDDVAAVHASKQRFVAELGHVRILLAGGVIIFQ